MKAWFFALILSALAIGTPAAWAAEARAPEPVVAPDVVPEYQLGAGDKVRIIVYGEPTLTGEYSISSSGTISFPLIGDVPSSGLTVKAIQSDIEKKLSNGFMRKPQVSAEVLTYRPFYILGEVNRPGQYPYTSGLTVLKAVATAQGFTYRANTKRVYIKRGDNAAEQPYSLTSTTPVAPGDILRISERFF
ncbi:MAG: polysaccharide biosynthesis/export family protein [Phenylobacterium sp.]|uniref:polysaccharide biosynthesis/export family protein n=1 Tax=Phenylobacterium sp. TaxID=1871053 RepID=UPI002735805A|nr:polysaccharide biosynthesis/export family protein [Phenylobacterium sp.]MDP3175129.1 polysaccharide biosynthesis/export family protein [Phenylobacterium sp.]